MNNFRVSEIYFQYLFIIDKIIDKWKNISNLVKEDIYITDENKEFKRESNIEIIESMMKMNKLL